jgi:nitrate/TMAO reductase-like tetraheme cytochrome c subunit
MRMNRISAIGAFIAAATIANMVFLLSLQSLGGGHSPYFGILTYLVFPILLVVALLIIPAGMLLEWRRFRKYGPRELPLYPTIDLNSPRTRRLFALVFGSSLMFLVITAAASYQVYQFTESLTFCGLTCHTPMKPEYIAYQDSPHARVACVGCHVGPGASWYVQSKLSGAYQVYAVLFNKYPRPIPTPIHNLRPVREACEQCHWPKKFYGGQLKTFIHFGYDENNSPFQIQMLIKTGGGEPGHRYPAGIHWHMNLANKVSFISTDRQHQVIPWVRVEDSQGQITEYLAKGTSWNPKQIANAPKQVIDCVSCHSRPSHKFSPPDQAVDEAFAAGLLDRSLPYLKKQGVAVLTETYPNTRQAMEGIATQIDTFYRDQYRAIYQTKRPQISQAISTLQTIYRANIFPSMKVDWRAHPDNIGHLYYSGCFRCHDGQHVSSDGRTIPNDCDSCHTIIGETRTAKDMSTVAGQHFQHPIDLATLVGVNCDTCHTGGVL